MRGAHQPLGVYAALVDYQKYRVTGAKIALNFVHTYGAGECRQAARRSQTAYGKIGDGSPGNELRDFPADFLTNPLCVADGMISNKGAHSTLNSKGVDHHFPYYEGNLNATGDGVDVLGGQLVTTSGVTYTNPETASRDESRAIATTGPDFRGRFPADGGYASGGTEPMFRDQFGHYPGGDGSTVIEPGNADDGVSHLNGYTRNHTKNYADMVGYTSTVQEPIRNITAKPVEVWAYVQVGSGTLPLSDHGITHSDGTVIEHAPYFSIERLKEMSLAGQMPAGSLHHRILYPGEQAEFEIELDMFELNRLKKKLEGAVDLPYMDWEDASAHIGRSVPTDDDGIPIMAAPDPIFDREYGVTVYVGMSQLGAGDPGYENNTMDSITVTGVLKQQVNFFEPSVAQVLDQHDAGELPPFYVP